MRRVESEHNEIYICLHRVLRLRCEWALVSDFMVHTAKLKKHSIVKFHVSCIHLKNEFPRETLIARDDRCIKRRWDNIELSKP